MSSPPLNDQTQSYLPSFKQYLSSNTLNEINKFFKHLITTTQPNPLLSNLQSRLPQEKDVRHHSIYIIISIGHYRGN